MNRFLCILAAAALLLSCSKEGGGSIAPDNPGSGLFEQSSVPVGFSDSFTKADDPSKTAFSTGDAIGVFGYYTGEAEKVVNTHTPNFMYNQLVTLKEGGNWEYSPVKYWSNNPDDHFTFYAYYPHNSLYNQLIAPGMVWSANTATGAPTLTYSTPDNMGSKVDLLYAVAETQSKQAVSEKVQFTFKHALAKVQFKFDVADSKTAYIKSVGINVPANGTFNYTESSSLPQWNNVTGSKPLLQELSGNGILVPLKDGENIVPVQDFTVFVLPGTISNLAIGLSTDLHTFTTVNAPTSIEVVAGKVTTVTVTVTPKELAITAQTQNWSEATYSPIFTPDKE